MEETTIRVAMRATARISFVLFLGAFLGDALYRLMPAAATRWLKAHKDGFTLGFAGSHTVHLAFILTLVVAIGREHAFKGNHGRPVHGRVPAHLCSGCWRSASSSHILVFTF